MTAKRNAQEHLERLFQPRVAMAERLQHLACLRSDPEFGPIVDGVLLEKMDHQHRALERAEDSIRQAQAAVEKLSALPWFPASFIQLVQVGSTQRALVREGAVSRIVEIGAGIDPASLCPCEEVLLGQHQNIILGRMGAGASYRSGEICCFKNPLPDGRILVTCQGEDIGLHAPAALGKTLRKGDLVLCDRVTNVAVERVEQEAATHLFLEGTPRETFADVGGLEPQINKIKNALLLHWQHPELARKYQLARTGSILLCGPPGTGKTLIARAFANFIASLAPSGNSLFASIKPLELHSMWYSESERAYREVFRVARERGTSERPVVLFFDEIDAVGSTRGQSLMRAHDNVLTALITELDGLQERGNVLVVAATNRRDALDPALVRPGRLGDLVLEVPRPKRVAAREIFARHLDRGIPFARNGHGDDLAATRAEIIEACLASIYAPNAEELATIVFRDNSRRGVRPPDLTSGAVIANICRSAKSKACEREIAGSAEAGLCAEDLLLAANEEFGAAARGLTVLNCRQHLELPQDLDVVRVEPALRKVSQPLRYLQAA